MQAGMPRPNAAIYYALDAYDTSRPHLMGRHSAGEGFLRGFVRHGGADRLYCYARHAGDAQDFAKRVKAHGATVPITWIPFADPQRLAEPGCLFYPTVGVDELAWRRRRHDQRAYSVVGITHTIVSGAVMEVIANWLIAPVQPWDAVICTSKAVREAVDTVIEAQRPIWVPGLARCVRACRNCLSSRSASIATPTGRCRRYARIGGSGSALAMRMSPSCFSDASAFTARRIPCRCIAACSRRCRASLCRRAPSCT